VLNPRSSTYRIQFPEQLAVSVNWRTYAHPAQRMSKCDLIRGKHGPTQIFLQRRNHPNGAKPISAKETPSASDGTCFRTHS
jgi:hypothetical protein